MTSLVVQLRSQRAPFRCLVTIEHEHLAPHVHGRPPFRNDATMVATHARPHVADRAPTCIALGNAIQDHRAACCGVALADPAGYLHSVDSRWLMACLSLFRCRFRQQTAVGRCGAPVGRPSTRLSTPPFIGTMAPNVLVKATIHCCAHVPVLMCTPDKLAALALRHETHPSAQIAAALAARIALHPDDPHAQIAHIFIGLHGVGSILQNRRAFAGFFVFF